MASELESMAINVYVARHYGGTLYALSAEDVARAWRGKVWNISEFEPLQMRIAVQKLFTPE